MTLKQLFDKINGCIERFINWLDKLLDEGQYQPTNQEPTQYS